MSKRPTDEKTSSIEMKRKYPDSQELANKPSTSSQKNQDKEHGENVEENTVQEGMRDLPTTSTSTIEIPSRDWQIDRNLQSCLLNMYENDRWTDMTIICGDGARPLKAHKLILASRSPVFEAMFYGPCSEPKNEYNFPDFDVDIFDMMLRYIYTDNVQLKNDEDAILLIQMGDMYQMRTLVNHCASFLESKINIENVLVSLDCALKYDLPSLRDKCCNYIDEYAVQVLNRPEFETVSFEVLSYVLKGDTLYAAEDFIFRKVVNWATVRLSGQGKEVNGKNIREILGDAFYDNRLTTLGTYGMKKCIEGKDFFSTKEDEEIVDFTENKISELSFLSNEERVCLDGMLTMSCSVDKYLFKEEITQTYDLLVSNDVFIESIAIPYIPVYLKISLQRLAIVGPFCEFVERIPNKQSLPQGLQQLSVSITIDEINFKQHFVIHQCGQATVQKLDNPLLLEKESSPMKLKVEIKPLCSSDNMRLKCQYGSLCRCGNTWSNRLSIDPIYEGFFALEKVWSRNRSFRENEKAKVHLNQ